MGSIIANINNGGYTNYLDPFLQQEFKEEAFNLDEVRIFFIVARKSFRSAANGTVRGNHR